MYFTLEAGWLQMLIMLKKEKGLRMKNRPLVSVVVLVAGLLLQSLAAFVPTTGTRSFEQALRPATVENKKFHIRVTSEALTAARGYDIDGHRCDVLSVYEKDQATIMALRNPLPDKAAGAQRELMVNMRAPADDGVRGHVALRGNFNQVSVAPTVGASIELGGIPGSFGLDVHVPVVRKQMSVSTMQDLTRVHPDPLFQPLFDVAVANRVAAWPTTASTLGALSTENVTTSGLGDTAIMLSWRNNFKQDKELIKAVELFAQVGVMLPTGRERDEDKMFSMALGSDGAFGIPVGVGLNVQFVNTIRAGLNVDFLAHLDKTRDRRLKTIAQQTELFLLNKGKATRDYGLDWQFYLYLQSRHFVGGLSAKAAYQYLRHDADKLTPRDNGFSYDVINTSKRLSESYAHNVIFSLDYDHLGTDAALVVPQLGLFYKLPVGGKAVLAMQSVGVHMGVNF